MSGRALTPSQTVGPFFHMILREPMNALATPQTTGTRIRIEGVVYDGDRAVVPDAMVEIWQANADDPVLHLVPQQRRPTLLAKHRTDGSRVVYRFDIVLQGDGETVFFDL